MRVQERLDAKDAMKLKGELDRSLRSVEFRTRFIPDAILALSYQVA